MQRVLFSDAYGTAVIATDSGVRLVSPAPRTLNEPELECLLFALAEAKAVAWPKPQEDAA